MHNTEVFVYEVETPEGHKRYVSLMPHKLVLKRGLIPEAIVGELRPSSQGDGEISPESFARNRVFVDFLHQIIGNHGRKQPACQAEAKRIANGWICVVDQRTPTPGDAVPPEDILGAFEAKDGEIHSYSPNPNHRILSERGFFGLQVELYAILMQELKSLSER